MKPILRDFPESFDTDRLTIRAPRAGDGAEMNAAIRESWEELQPWMPWAAGEPPPAEGTEERMRQARVRFLLRENLWLLLFLKGSHELVGSSGLHRINWDVPSFEIGYWVRTSYSGRGYITEAVKGITNFAITHLSARRLEIQCDSRNERSAAVARRAGYQHEATLQNHERHHLTGQLRDTLIFSKTLPDE